MLTFWSGSTISDFLFINELCWNEWVPLPTPAHQLKTTNHYHLPHYLFHSKELSTHYHLPNTYLHYPSKIISIQPLLPPPTYKIVHLHKIVPICKTFMSTHLLAPPITQWLINIFLKNFQWIWFKILHKGSFKYLEKHCAVHRISLFISFKYEKSYFLRHFKNYFESCFH